VLVFVLDTIIDSCFDQCVVENEMIYFDDCFAVAKSDHQNVMQCSAFVNILDNDLMNIDLLYDSDIGS
jgi:hypothetical protein